MMHSHTDMLPLQPPLPHLQRPEPRQQRAGDALQVGIGQLKVTGRGGLLQAVLGSCIGIAFLWEKRGLYGLAHCLLPEPHCDRTASAASATFAADIASLQATGARYVSHAVPALLRLMGAREADYADITVILAGGASMFESSRLCVGRENAAAAHKYLAQRGLKVRDHELGGKHGRQLLIDCAQHSYTIKDLKPSCQDTRYEHH